MLEFLERESSNRVDSNTKGYIGWDPIAVGQNCLCSKEGDTGETEDIVDLEGRSLTQTKPETTRGRQYRECVEEPYRDLSTLVSIYECFSSTTLARNASLGILPSGKTCEMARILGSCINCPTLAGS